MQDHQLEEGAVHHSPATLVAELNDRSTSWVKRLGWLVLFTSSVMITTAQSIPEPGLQTAPSPGNSAGQWVAPDTLNDPYLPDGERIVASPPSEDVVVFTTVDEVPEFPGGETAMMQYIAEHIRYPDMKGEGKVRVLVRFVVMHDGAIRDVRVLHSEPFGTALDAEAVRVVRGMPNWIPAKANGQNVNASKLVPIEYLP